MLSVSFISKVIHIRIVDKSNFNLSLMFGFYVRNSKYTKMIMDIYGYRISQ